MKKISKLMLVAALAMAVLLLAGCSAAGNGYMNIAKEVNTLDKYSFTGDMQMGISMDDLLAGEEMTPDVQEAMDMLSNINVKYSGQVANNVYAMDMDMTMGKYNIPMKVYMNDKQMLMNADSIIKMAEAMGADQSEIAATKQAVGSMEWLNLADMDDMLGDVLQGVDMVGLTNDLYAVMDAFANNSFKNYDPGCFSGSSSQGYTVSVSDANLKALATDFVSYVKANYAAVSQDLNQQAAAIDKGLLASMGVDSAALKEALTSLQNIDNATVGETADQIAAMLKGTNFKNTIKKQGSGNYTETASGSIVINDEENGLGSIAVKLNMKMDIDATKDVSVSMPTQNVSSLKAIADTLPPVAVDATFFMDDEELYLSKNYEASLFDTTDTVTVKAILKDNYNYFPMRQISEMFGEKVVWDKATGEIYVDRNGTKIDMSGFIRNYTTYVKLRDFEKLGYEIGYEKDPELGGIATIYYEYK